MNSIALNLLLDKINGSGNDEEISAVSELDKHLGAQLAVHLLDRFKNAKKCKARDGFAWYSIRYRHTPAALELGLLAIKDKSTGVRIGGCLLLACIQSDAALPDLYAALELQADDKKHDFLAAIDAIESKNPHYFVDRQHTGLSKLMYFES
jgi:hypothetical protein